MDITLTPMTRPLCHEFYQGFENDPDTFMDMTRFTPYEYTPERPASILRNSNPPTASCS